jgi:hypothetical protein
MEEIFRDQFGNFTGALFEYIGLLYGVMYAIEINHDNGWTNFMLECDFLVIFKAFTNTSIVPWRLQNIRLAYSKDCFLGRVFNKRVTFHRYHIIISYYRKEGCVHA